MPRIASRSAVAGFLIRHIFAVVVFIIAAGCSPGRLRQRLAPCCGGITPLVNGFDPMNRIENAGSARLTPHGLVFLEKNLGSLAKGLLGGTGTGGVIEACGADEHDVDRRHHQRDDLPQRRQPQRQPQGVHRRDRHRQRRPHHDDGEPLRPAHHRHDPPARGGSPGELRLRQPQHRHQRRRVVPRRQLRPAPGRRGHRHPRRPEHEPPGALRVLGDHHQPDPRPDRGHQQPQQQPARVRAAQLRRPLLHHQPLHLRGRRHRRRAHQHPGGPALPAAHQHAQLVDREPALPEGHRRPCPVPPAPPPTAA